MAINRGGDDDKVEFVKLVEPLMQTMKSDNQELAALATSALVNLCSYSPDIKQIFLTKKEKFGSLQSLFLPKSIYHPLCHANQFKYNLSIGSFENI